MGYAEVVDTQTSNTVKNSTQTKTRKRKGSPKTKVGSVQSQIAAVQNRIDTLTKQAADLDKQIADLQKIIDDFETNTGLLDTKNRAELAKLKRDRTLLGGQIISQTSLKNGFEKQVQEKATKAWTDALNAKAKAAGVDVANANLTTDAPSTNIGALTGDADLARVNLSAARELYLKGNENFIKETLDIQGFVSNKGGSGSFNSPTFSSAFASYQTAQNLWKDGKATKGRIQTWMPPSNTLPSYLPATSDTTFKDRQLDIDRRIFQFHYNPGSISMAYNGVPDIDVTMYTAGVERFNLWNQSKSTISFELLLNRMPDMKYIDPKNANYRKPGVNYLNDVYDRNPVNNELKEIHEKGTMYDVEFLLRVLLGYRLRSQLRGGKLTSDVGWITPRPVELHLGSSLRYLVNIVSLNLNHVIFNERMVPLFTTVSITGTRIPDFDADTSTASGGKK